MFKRKFITFEKKNRGNGIQFQTKFVDGRVFRFSSIELLDF